MTPKLIQVLILPRTDPVVERRMDAIILGLDAEGQLWQPRVAELGGPTPRINWQRVTQTFEGGDYVPQVAVEQPDLAKELTAWLDNNVVRCWHGGVLCGLCFEAAARDGLRR